MSIVSHTRERPYFFWDYEISDDEVRHLLRHGKQLGCLVGTQPEPLPHVDLAQIKERGQRLPLDNAPTMSHSLGESAIWLPVAEQRQPKGCFAVNHPDPPLFDLADGGIIAGRPVVSTPVALDTMPCVCIN